MFLFRTRQKFSV